MDWLRQLPIGQYVAEQQGGGSWLWRLDSRLKLLWTLAFLLSPILAGPIWRLSLVLALVAQCICTALLIMFSGFAIPGVGLVITWSVVGLLSFILNIYFWSLMISIIASFIAPYSGHPALVLVRQITEPVMEPFRRLLPSMGGLDLSPIFVFLGLQIIRMVFIDPVGVNARVVLGI